MEILLINGWLRGTPIVGNPNMVYNGLYSKILDKSLAIHPSNIDRKPWYLHPALIGVSYRSFTKIEGIEPQNRSGFSKIAMKVLLPKWWGIGWTPMTMWGGPGRWVSAIVIFMVGWATHDRFRLAGAHRIYLGLLFGPWWQITYGSVQQ